MADFCVICHDREDLSQWKHPVSNDEYLICAHCQKNIVGYCMNCQEIIFKVERYGYDEQGNLICPKCVHMAELSEDACKK